uniref:Uncharacterized protein n=1 Tax=Opuntia streptacantha TaxID=393608 RepID=A0A7C8ZQ89_OPUST
MEEFEGESFGEALVDSERAGHNSAPITTAPPSDSGDGFLVHAAGFLLPALSSQLSSADWSPADGAIPTICVHGGDPVLATGDTAAAVDELVFSTPAIKTQHSKIEFSLSFSLIMTAAIIDE